MKDGTVKMAGTTAEREEKLKARIVRNRIAAQVSREKKRQQMDDLEATNSVLLAEIQSLKDHLKSAETEKNLLSVQVQALSNTVASLQSHLFNNGSSSLALAPSTPDSLSLAPSPLPYQSDTTSPVSTTSSPSNLLETEDLFADLSAFFPTTPSAPSSFTSTTFPTFDLSQPAPFDPLSYLLSPLPTFTLPNTTRPEPATGVFLDYVNGQNWGYLEMQTPNVELSSLGWNGRDEGMDLVEALFSV
ncbi:hypothetical protein BC829DRAFT_400542 [Chytridium lagenaria]|nr:hypothetical protein BC829DRAFT_400542 [Chytridium lagenaria]